MFDIGYWVKRPYRGKWHLVESMIAGEPVTKCGRRLRHGAHPLHASAITPFTRMIDQPQLCKHCYGGQ